MIDSAVSFLRRLIFSVCDSSLSPILVWTQLPTTEASVSAVLALLAAVPTAALAAVDSAGMEMRERGVAGAEREEEDDGGGVG
jgi:hypothetical protein